VLELGGVRNVLAKSLGTTNPINMAKATVTALQDLRRPEDVAKMRGKRIHEVLPLQTAVAEVLDEAAEEQAPLEEAALAVAVVEAEPAVVEETSTEETPAEEPAAEAEQPAAEAEPAAEAPAEPEKAAEKPKRRTLRRKKDDS